MLEHLPMVDMDPAVIGCTHDIDAVLVVRVVKSGYRGGDDAARVERGALRLREVAPGRMEGGCLGLESRVGLQQGERIAPRLAYVGRGKAGVQARKSGIACVP